MGEAELIKAIDTYQLEVFKDALGFLRQQNNFEPEQLKALVDRSVRNKALQFGASDSALAETESFVKFIIELAKQDYCSKVITIQVLQDIFDVSTTSRCGQLFEIVENNIDKWKTKFFFDSCKNQILRMCNDLLKRLSRTVDTTFCGRILILLAKSLPFNEKSGLNLTGQFNTQNVTTYEREKKEQLDESQPPLTSAEDDMEVGEIRDLGESSGAIPVDYNMYVKFWDLQKYFSNPNLLFEPTSYKNFNEVLAEVLGIFTTYKLEGSRRQREHSQTTLSMNEDGIVLDHKHFITNLLKVEPDADGSKSQNSNIGGGMLNGFMEKMEVDEEGKTGQQPAVMSKQQRNSQTEHSFFAKYLTSQKLFPLQLADSQFRRYFLLQYLIVANYLLLKIKLKETFVLTAAQEEEIRELADKCFLLLRETYPHGSLFSEAIKKVLSRERFWSSWKNEGCPDLITPLLNSPNIKCVPFKRKAISSYFVPGQLDLGNKELTRLWNIQSNNLLACKEAKRKNIPNLKKFVEDAIDEFDPEQQVEEQYQSVNDEKYQWMASRFMLFNSDQYVSCTVQDSRSQQITTAAFLKKTIQMTAENIPELKERAEQIQAVIKKRESAERTRLMAEAKELEKLEKKAKQQQQKEENDQQKKEKEEPINSAKEGTNTAGTASTPEQRHKDQRTRDQPSEQTQTAIKKRESTERSRLAETKDVEKLEKKAKLQQGEEDQRKREREEAANSAKEGTINAGTASTPEQRHRDQRTRDQQPHTPTSTTDEKIDKEKHHGSGGGGGHGRPSITSKTVKRKEPERGPKEEKERGRELPKRKRREK